jgi:hypothetical protein
MSRAVIPVSRSPEVSDAFPEPIRDAAPTGSAGAPQQPDENTYRDRLFKYIPGEVVTLYLLLSAIIAPPDSPHFLRWVVFFACLIGTPLYLRFPQKVAVPVQLVISTIAFAVWVFALGGPFSDIPGYKPIYGAVALPVFTFFVAIITPRESPGG